MCNVYNILGSLATIKTKLAQNNIHDFKSIGELISFHEKYPITRQEIIAKHRILISDERDNLGAEIYALQQEISNDKSEVERKPKAELDRLRQKHSDVLAMKKNYFQEIMYTYVAVFLMLKIKYKELFPDSKVPDAILWKEQTLAGKKARRQYLVQSLDEAVHESSGFALHYLDRKKKVVDEITPYIYGAIGEQKVVKELENLSDEYTLINDFCFSFAKPIFYHETKQYIKTIQIDHLLISPAGVFLLETKNWSKDSLKNLSLRSPVEQIKRTNYALFKILSGDPSLNLTRHHWGERKISIRNLIVLINQRPPEEFQHVKVLTLNELLGYVQYFKPILSREDTEKVATYLLRLAERN